MSETCPLRRGLYWDGAIPDTCRKHCEDTWEEAIRIQKSIVDTFAEDCDDASPCGHDVENGGMALQRLDENMRGLGLLSICAATHDELWSEDYVFDCKIHGLMPPDDYLL